MSGRDTIAAIATAAGRGGIGVIRVSGPESRRLAERLASRTLTPRHAHFSTLSSSDGEALDDAVVIYYPLPGSFTGEDVLELLPAEIVVAPRTVNVPLSWTLIPPICSIACHGYSNVR